MNENPTGFVNWADYLGVNQESVDQQLKKLVDPLNKQEGDLQNAQAGFTNEARMQGQAGGPAYGGTGSEDNYRNGLMSYGAAVERLRDPATRQAVMQRQFGAATALDAALVGGGGGNQLQQLEQRKKGLMASDETMSRNVDARYAQGKKETAAWEAGQAGDNRNRQAAADASKKNQLGFQRAMASYDNPYNQNMSPHDRMLAIQNQANGGGWAWDSNNKQGGQYGNIVQGKQTRLANGNIDWDAYYGNEEKKNAETYANRPRPDPWIRNLVGMQEWPDGMSDPSKGDSWSQYYNAKK